MDATHLKVWLPFDESTTLDRCGNSWTAYSNPSISDGALSLVGPDQYLSLNGGLTFGGRDFTVSGEFLMNSSTGKWARIFGIFIDTETEAKNIRVARDGDSARLNVGALNVTGRCPVTMGTAYHFELDYHHSSGTVDFFLGGVKQLTLSVTIPRMNFTHCWLGRSNFSADGYFNGTLDNFMVFDGVALHSEDFTPPTTADYAAITSWAVTANADIEALIANRDPSSGYWRYENPGSGDYMDSQPAVVTETVDYKQSVTGVAFHNGNQSDMCNTPAGVREIWMRFDLYWVSDSSSTYVLCYVGNQATAGFYGVRFGGSAMDNTGNKCFFTNSDTVAYLASTSRNRCLLHMISGITDGFMEFALNGTPYVCVSAGNVNNGEDFRNPFFYNFVRIWHPDWNGLFSNIVVSNAPLSLDDGWHRNQLPVEHNIKAVDLCVRKNGRTYEIPFSTTNSAPVNSVIARVGGKTVYNPLVATTDENASGLKVRCNGKDRALSASFN